MTRRGLSAGRLPSAVILAGGLGTRLRSILGDLPKALAPVAGKPFLTYQLDWLKRCGVRRVVLCTGYQHQLVQDCLGDGTDLGLSIHYSVEEQPLGTAGALRKAKDKITGTFLVLNGDTYLDVDLKALLSYHRETAALTTLALMQVDQADRYGTVVVDAGGRISGFCEKGQSGEGLVNAGLYVCEPSLLGCFPEGEPLSLEMDVFPSLARQGLLRGYVVEGYIRDIGTPESYAQFVRDVKQKRLAEE